MVEVPGENLAARAGSAKALIAPAEPASTSSTVEAGSDAFSDAAFAWMIYQAVSQSRIRPVRTMINRPSFSRVSIRASIKCEAPRPLNHVIRVSLVNYRSFLRRQRSLQPRCR